MTSPNAAAPAMTDELLDLIELGLYALSTLDTETLAEETALDLDDRRVDTLLAHGTAVVKAAGR